MDEEYDTLSDTTGYDSLITVSPSLLDMIVVERQGQNFSALGNHYLLPYSDQVKACEAVFYIFSQTLNQGDLYWEPELERGSVAEVLSKEGSRVLDVGCGMEGLWASTMATRFDKTEVLAVDLIPVEVKWCPPNVTFQVSDVNFGLPFQSEYFDVVQVRSVSPWISIEHRMSAIRRVLKPGGIFLLQEEKAELHRADGSLVLSVFENPPGTLSWAGRFDALAQVIARNTSEPGDQPYVGELVDVQDRVVEIHLGVDSSFPEHLERQKAGKLLREALLGWFKLPVLRIDSSVAQAARLVEISKLIPARDSEIYDTMKNVWARKAVGRPLVEYGARYEERRGAATVDASLPRELRPELM